MLKAYTIARPYANAIFELAKKNNTFKEWGNLLSSLSNAVQDKIIIEYIKNPSSKVRNIFNNLFYKSNDNSSYNDLQNFLDIIIENKRLLLVPHIKEIYLQLLSQYEKKYDVIIKSAYNINSEQTKQILVYLEKKFNKKLNPILQVCPDLIGGIKAVLENEVVDLSVSSYLSSIKSSILSN